MIKKISDGRAFLVGEVKNAHQPSRQNYSAFSRIVDGTIEEGLRKDFLVRYNGPRFSFDTLMRSQGWMNIGQAVTRLHVPRRSVEMYQRTGMTIGAADRAATRLGIAPNTIWPNFYDDIVKDVDLDDFDSTDVAFIRYAVGKVMNDLREPSARRDQAAELLSVLAMCPSPAQGVGVA